MRSQVRRYFGTLILNQYGVKTRAGFVGGSVPKTKEPTRGAARLCKVGRAMEKTLTVETKKENSDSKEIVV